MSTNRLGSGPQLNCCLSKAMIDEFDLDQDGEISEQEFFAIMTDDAWNAFLSVYQRLLHTRIIDLLYVCMSVLFSVVLTLCFTDQCIPNSYVDCIFPMTLGFFLRNYKAQSTDRVLDIAPPFCNIVYARWSDAYATGFRRPWTNDVVENTLIAQTRSGSTIPFKPVVAGLMMYVVLSTDPFVLIPRHRRHIHLFGSGAYILIRVMMWWIRWLPGVASSMIFWNNHFRVSPIQISFLFSHAEGRNVVAWSMGVRVLVFSMEDIRKIISASLSEVVIATFHIPLFKKKSGSW